MRVHIKGNGPRGSLLNEQGDIVRTRKSIVRMAKELRQCMTPAEKLLWKKLSKRKLEKLKFYRQVPVDRYIVDFYCPEKKIIIEVDGSIHDEQDIAKHDDLRTQCFRKKGLRILRIRNEEIFQNIEHVCKIITQKCASHTK